MITDFPEYYHYFSEIDFTWNGIHQQNRNPLLYKNIGVDGLKTGHAEQAGYGLTASGVQSGHRIILVINGLPSMQARADEPTTLMEWGWHEFRLYDLFKAHDVIDNAPMWLGAAETVPVAPDSDVRETLSTAERHNLKATIVYDGPTAAPIKAGQKMGVLRIEAQGQPTQEVSLVATADVARLGGCVAHLRRAAQLDHRPPLIMPGRFITFEGGEGAGKSTQVKKLAETLRTRGRTVVTTREPGGTPGAEDIRKLLVSGERERWLPLSEVLLFAAARYDHVERVIKPALERRDWVLCDRFRGLHAGLSGLWDGPGRGDVAQGSGHHAERLSA